MFTFKSKNQRPHAVSSGAKAGLGPSSPAHNPASAPDTYKLREDIYAFIGLLALIPTISFVLTIACGIYGDIQ